ncbi:MAG: hypothetical protein ACLSFZ_00915 [Frisingicoccus sp.]
MNNTTKKSLTLQKKKLQSIDQRMEALSAQGVKASQEHSGELNFSGCASVIARLGINFISVWRIWKQGGRTEEVCRWICILQLKSVWPLFVFLMSL